MTSETAKPKRRSILSQHTLRRLDPEIFHSITAPANSNSDTKCPNSCPDANCGAPVQLPEQRP